MSNKNIAQEQVVAHEESQTPLPPLLEKKNIDHSPQSPVLRTL